MLDFFFNEDPWKFLWEFNENVKNLDPDSDPNFIDSFSAPVQSSFVIFFFI